LIDSAYESIIIAQDGLVKFVNPAALSLLDLNSKQEIIEVPFPEFIHPDDRGLVIENYRRRIAGKQVPTRYDFRVIGKHGSEKWVEINGAFIEWQGKPATLNFLTDITDRKKSDLLLSQQLFFTNALNKIAEIIIIKDNPDNILESVNSIIGSTLQLDRSLIYYVSFQKNNIKGLCKWSKPDNPKIVSIKEEYTSLEMFIHSATEIMKTQKHLESHFNAVNEHFKEEEASLLHNELKIKSLLWYPFAFDEHGFYLFTLSQITGRRKWTQEELDFLESVAYQLNLALMKIKLLEERKQTEEQLIETKERSLISQLKPHFIFNTLTAIQSYIYSNSPGEANQYISSFASLMRIYLTNSQNEFITVKEEITTIKYYLELQKLRYQDKFDYSVSFDNEEELAFITIPPMLTQPLVENAIEHGIQNKGSKGFVNISFSLSDNYIVFTVEDDGPGIAFTKNLKKSDKHLSVSTSIIKERLKWLNKKYSQKIIYEISDIIEDGEIAGTLAKMSIPYKD
jgi:PAS domain S-box-containing protein